MYVGILMGGAGRHGHCKASNVCPHAQVLPGAQVIKISFVLSDVGKFIKIFKNLPQNLVKNVRDYQLVYIKNGYLASLNRRAEFNQNQQAYAI